MKRLCIIVLVYNAEHFLEQCLESIINQSYRELEIVLVNDGSVDASSEICHKYEHMDERIKVVDLENNMGMIHGRQVGLYNATAEYVTFVDSDDWIEIERCQKIIEIIENFKVDFINTGSVWYWGAKDIRYEYSLVEQGFYDLERIRTQILPQLWIEKSECWRIMPSLCFGVFKRQMLLDEYDRLEVNRFNNGEDALVVLPYILKSNNLYIMHECDYYYRQRPRGQATHYQVSSSYYADLLELYTHLEKCFRDYDTKENELIKQINLYYISLVNKRRILWSGNRYPVRFLFPFNKVEKDSKIVLYGAGMVGEAYYDQISRLGYCKSILWVDKNYMRYDMSRIFPIETLFKADYDYVVVANSSPASNKIIADDLIENGVPEHKIICGENI